MSITIDKRIWTTFILYFIIHQSFEVLCEPDDIIQENQYIHAEFEDLRSTIEESAQKFLHMKGLVINKINYSHI